MNIFKRPTILFLLLITLGLAIWSYFDNISNVTHSLLEGDEPTYKSELMLTTVYAPSGKLSYKLVSEQVEHFADSEDTWFTKPVMTLYDESATATWTIRADKAKLTANKMLYLFGNAEVDSLSPDSQIEKIKTDRAEINLTTQDIMSDDEVFLFGNSFTTTGLKLRGNLRSKTANLLERVNTNYGTTH